MQLVKADWLTSFLHLESRSQKFHKIGVSNDCVGLHILLNAGRETGITYEWRKL